MAVEVVGGLRLQGFSGKDRARSLASILLLNIEPKHMTDAPLCARQAPARARLTKAQKTEINRKAHAAALEFEQQERQRLTKEALKDIANHSGESNE
ncbi:hypothetical protein ACQKC8_23050 [Stutzerimonas stutzeri]|uniref:hypothetical protein n=1 Tax=Stutzerimonas stutzeri TaxID=316 RepID=UPI003C2F132A